MLRPLISTLLNTLVVDIMGNNIDKVCTGLYVGGLMDEVILINKALRNSATSDPFLPAKSATKKEVLAESNITHVLTLLEGAEPHFPDDFKYKRVDVADSPNTNLSRHFRECVDFIHECRINGGSCYVHCAAGISRAITVCTMYVMTVSTLTYEEALTVLQYSRRVANPNFGFRMQLKKYARETLEGERKDLKERFPDSSLDDDSELRKKFVEATETFAKEGRPPLSADDDAYIDPASLPK